MTQRRRRPAPRGMVLLEVLMAVVLAGLGLLGHAAGILRVHNLNRSEESRTLALQTVRATVERMRDDADWAGLYLRLTTLRDKNGGWHPVGTYYSDLAVPHQLGTVTMRMEVPRATAADATVTKPVFREDVEDERFGLPFDMNGDGVLGPTPVDTTYLILPLRVTLRWQAAGEFEQEVRLSTWLKGERR